VGTQQEVGLDNDSTSTREARRTESDLVQTLFRERTRYIEQFTRELLAPSDQRTGPTNQLQGRMTVEELKEKLTELDRAGEVLGPTLVHVSGVFAPSILLTVAWWERRRSSASPRMSWRDPVQEWLFTGFDLWGPSWDLSLASELESGQMTHLLGQLGSADEADSIPIVIHQRKAQDIRDTIGPQRVVFQAEVTGLLVPASQLSPSEVGRLTPLERAPANAGGRTEYCLLLRDDDQEHDILLSSRRPKLYSAYLWQCWGPTPTADNPPRLSDVYFVWEHANLSDRECIDFHLDALEHKVKQLGPRFPQDAVLLQKSHSSLIKDTPAMSATDFYSFLVHADRETTKA
jgi:hypothetical protein